MHLKYFFAVVVLCSNICSSADTKPSPSPAQIVDPAIFYNTMEMVCGEGYSVQEYQVTTDDGYILTVHRIPNGKKRDKVPRKRTHYQQLHKGYHPDFENCINESRYEKASGPPVLLSHGLLSASDGWLLQGAKYDLAYYLVDAGYDVWLTNIRGNYYSRRHVSISPSDPAFWDFSFHEHGFYDMSATIDLVLKVSGYKKLYYVGHSMGTTMFFTLMSSRPEYNDKIQLFVGLAPVAQLKQENFRGSRAAAAQTAFIFIRAIKAAGGHEFLPRSILFGIVAKTLCGRGSPIQNFCYDIVFSFIGYHSKLYLRKIFPMIVSHGLSGTTIKVILHYMQLVNATSFRSYDYGPEKNFQKYAQVEPIEYDLRKVTAACALYYSYDDYIVDAKDSENLLNFLPNVAETFSMQKYSHTDFIWAYNSREVIHKKVLEIMNRFRNQ